MARDDPDFLEFFAAEWAVVGTRHLLASRPEDRHQPDFAGDDLVLWQALQHLPTRQRAAVVLRYYLDLPEAEVARLAPPEHAAKALAQWPPAAVTVTAGGGYYVGEAPEPGFRRGRLPGGQAYLRFESDPAQMGAWPGQPKPAANVADRPRTGTFSVDWGRDCKGIRPYRCGPHGLTATIYAGSTALWNRYWSWPRRSSARPAGHPDPAIVRGPRPARLPTGPVAGDLDR